MDIDEVDSNSNVFKKPATPALNFHSFIRPTMSTTATGTNTGSTTTSFSTMNTPLRSHARRSSSGIFFNTMFSMTYNFRHLRRLHMESLEGLNAIKQPPVKAVFRSSLPATPIATPIYRDPFPLFTEQTLIERLCKTRTPSPRRSYSRNSSQMDTSDDQVQPMDICSPASTIDEESTPTNSASSPNKQVPTPADIQNSLNDIYYKINDQFSPD